MAQEAQQKPCLYRKTKASAVSGVSLPDVVGGGWGHVWGRLVLGYRGMGCCLGFRGPVWLRAEIGVCGGKGEVLCQSCFITGCL